MSEQFEKPANDMSKEELVWAVALLLNLHDMKGEVNKLSKPALWRIFDSYSERGNAFANLEDELRIAQREAMEFKTRALTAEKKVRIMEGKRNGKV